MHKDGDERGERVWLIDFVRPEKNEFVVASQFTVIENHQNKRPDLVLFVNGIPLVVIELKNAADENATLKTEASHLVGQLVTLINGMLNKATLLDLVRHFIVFEKGRKEDPKTGQITISTVKKLAAYHQYYAVNAAVASTLRAADMNEPLSAQQSPVSQGGDDGVVGRRSHTAQKLSLRFAPSLTLISTFFFFNELTTQDTRTIYLVLLWQFSNGSISAFSFRRFHDAFQTAISPRRIRHNAVLAASRKSALSRCHKDSPGMAWFRLHATGTGNKWHR